MRKPFGAPIAQCPSCKNWIGDQHPNDWCPACSEPLPDSILEKIPTRAESTRVRQAKEAAEPAYITEVSTQSVILTTADWIEGFRVAETIDIITAECAFGMNLFRDFFAAMTDVFGGRSKATQKVLRDARRTCLQELRREARTIGADAVIAVDLDYSEFSGQGKSMLFIVASGTAVRLSPVTGIASAPAHGKESTSQAFGPTT